MNTDRIAPIARRIVRYTELRGLPLPDFAGGPTLEESIASLLERERLTDDEAFAFLTLSEHVDPLLDESFALSQMSRIVQGARLRRGCPANRMADAVSL